MKLRTPRLRKKEKKRMQDGDDGIAAAEELRESVVRNENICPHCEK